MTLRLFTPLAAALLLAACAPKQVATAPGGPNLNEGMASTCKPSTPILVPDAVAQAEIQMNNDGGWCALRVAEAGKPYVVGRVHDRPLHGRVVIRTAGEQTFVEYLPAAGYAGPDAFTAILRPRAAGQADSTVHVTVVVVPTT